VISRPGVRACAAGVVLAVLLAAGAAPVRAQGLDALLGRTVTDLRLLSGGQPLPDRQVEGLLEIRVGQPITMALVRETIVHVMSTGRFLDVRVEASPSEGGVAVVVDPLPIVVTGDPLRDHVAAVSVGIVDGEPLLDLDYAEDSGCDTDMNVVMTGAGGFVELQGTAEGAPFTRAEMDALVVLAERGIGELIAAQKAALSSLLPASR